jgi:peptidoglycan L-alanyl-D-glutamate endopeptidase CwlK
MSLGKTSLAKLAQCDIKLQQLIQDVAARVDSGECHGVEDITVLCGYRGKEEQNKAFRDGASKLLFPHSKHNRTPALAVDIAPFPIDWKDRQAFERLRAFVLERASQLGIRIRVISWDLPHFELV